MRGRGLGILRHPGLLTLLALGGGCPDDPEPASTAPPCKSGDCPVDEPLPSDSTVAAPAPAPSEPAPAERLRGAGVTTVHVDEASHRPAAPLLDTGNAPVFDPANTDVPPARVIRTTP